MPLDSFSNLKAEVVSYSGRNDIADKLDAIIGVVESRIFANQHEGLRIRQMQTRATASMSTTDRFLALPTDFLEMRKLVAYPSANTGDRWELMFQTPSQMVVKDAVTRPSQFAVTSQIEFDLLPDAAYTVEMQYWGRTTALSDSNTANDILTNYPDIYLYGCLWMVYKYGSEPDMAGIYYDDFIQAIRGANMENKSGRYGPTMTRRIKGCNP